MIFFLLIIPQFSWANNLTIFVFEKGTGDPVPEATVVFEKAGEFLQTNEEGIASFEDIELPDNLKVLSPGYGTFQLNIPKNSSSQKIYLEPLSFEGETLIVTEDRIEEKTSKFSLSAREDRRRPLAGGRDYPLP